MVVHWVLVVGLFWHQVTSLLSQLVACQTTSGDLCIKMCYKSSMWGLRIDESSKKQLRDAFTTCTTCEDGITNVNKRVFNVFIGRNDDYEQLASLFLASCY